jgi:small multidrug resistance family-3 protein
MSSRAIVLSVLLFALAGLMEIAGGYLVWQTVRESKPWHWAALGGALLLLYGVVPTLQEPHFGRVYAAYGGVFVALSLLWGAVVDGDIPDGPDLAGGLLCILGVAVIMYWPRS